MKPKFVVVSPQPTYVDHIGGITVAHTLAHQLQLFNEEVYIYADSTNPKYLLKCIPYGSTFDIDDNTIVILIAGAGEHTYLPHIPKFLTEAKNIVRWLVNHQVKPYPEHNRFYKYHTYWNTLPTQRIDGQLSVIEMNSDLFYNKQYSRKGNCYLIKGNLDEEPERAIHSQNDVCIDYYLHSLPGHEKTKFLSHIFNVSEVFISYTPLTFASVLAALCGCISIVIPKSNFDKDKWKSEIWCTKYGIAVGIDDIQWAVDTMPIVPSMIDQYVNITQPNQIQQFIRDSYSWIETNK